MLDIIIGLALLPMAVSTGLFIVYWAFRLMFIALGLCGKAFMFGVGCVNEADRMTAERNKK